MHCQTEKRTPGHAARTIQKRFLRQLKKHTRKFRNFVVCREIVKTEKAEKYIGIIEKRSGVILWSFFVLSLEWK